MGVIVLKVEEAKEVEKWDEVGSKCNGDVCDGHDIGAR
jgi:hypothetical protein